MTPARTPLRLLAGLTLATCFALAIHAQTPEPPKSSAETTPPPATPQTSTTPTAPTGQSHPYTGPMYPTSVHIFHLSSTPSQQEQVEILTALRNINDPRVKVALTPSQSTIFFAGTDDQIALAQKIIEALDKPRKTYRLTYTLIDLDGTKRVGDQHYSLVLFPGQKALLRQGDRVPVITGSYVTESNSQQNQVTYLDVGINIAATLDDSANALRLQTKVEQSSVIADHVGATVQDPLIRQAIFEGGVGLTPGKPLVIGSLDIIGTTRRIEIQATIEPLTP